LKKRETIFGASCGRKPRKKLKDLNGGKSKWPPVIISKDGKGARNDLAANRTRSRRRGHRVAVRMSPKGRSGRPGMSANGSLSGGNRTCRRHAGIEAIDPKRTSASAAVAKPVQPLSKQSFEQIRCYLLPGGWT
jgi:hypothetical protein